MAEHQTPDYPLADTLEVDALQAHRALGDPLRARILALLLERAATGKQLSEALDRPPGTVGHHLGVLEDAGLIRVVRTGQVRAITTKYYGRTARTFLLGHGDGPLGDEASFLGQAHREAAAGAGIAPGGGSTLRYARIPADRADEWMARLGDLATQFAAQPREGDVTYGLVVAIFPTDWRPLPPDHEGQDG